MLEPAAKAPKAPRFKAVPCCEDHDHPTVWFVMEAGSLIESVWKMQSAALERAWDLNRGAVPLKSAPIRMPGN